MNQSIPTILALLTLMSITTVDAEIREYPASESPCNQACSFDHRSSEGCMENAAVMDYLRSAMHSAFSGPLGDIMRSAQPACICALTKLELTGVISSVEIVKSTNDETASAVQHALLQTRLPAVPEEAKCILQAPMNPLPFSVEVPE